MLAAMTFVLRSSRSGSGSGSGAITNSHVQMVSTRSASLISGKGLVTRGQGKGCSLHFWAVHPEWDSRSKRFVLIWSHHCSRSYSIQGSLLQTNSRSGQG
jgi:hypothetical protein